MSCEISAKYITAIFSGIFFKLTVKDKAHSSEKFWRRKKLLKRVNGLYFTRIEVEFYLKLFSHIGVLRKVGHTTCTTTFFRADKIIYVTSVVSKAIKQFLLVLVTNTSMYNSSVLVSPQKSLRAKIDGIFRYRLCE